MFSKRQLIIQKGYAVYTDRYTLQGVKVVTYLVNVRLS